MRSVGALGRLIPKSSGGRVALGSGLGIATAAGITGYRNRSSARMNEGAFNQDAFRQDVLGKIRSGQLAVPQGATSIQDSRSGAIYGL